MFYHAYIYARETIIVHRDKKNTDLLLLLLLLFTLKYAIIAIGP